MRHIKFLAFLLGLLIAAPLAVPAPARAAILFSGGEDVDFTLIGSVPNTSGSTFRSGWARSSINSGDGNSLATPTNRTITPVVANQTTLWLHAEVYTVGTGAVSNFQAIGIYGSDGLRRLMVRGVGTGTVKLSTENTAGTFVDLVTCSAVWPTNSTLTKLDWYINYAVAGHTTLYANSVPICDYAGDITTNSITSVNRADFSCPYGSGSQCYWSEVILSSTSTLGLGVFTCYPVANGTNMTWSGSFANVNPTTINDSSSITTGAQPQSALFTCPALPAGTYAVPAMTQSARVQAGSTGPQTFYFMARPATGSTDYNNGSATTASTAFANYPNVWLTNPATSSAWTTADITTGVNFGIQSQP